MFNTFNRFLKKENQTPSNPPSNGVNDDITEKAQGFICPMCMASLPGPAELQSHFERVHSDGEDNLLESNSAETLPENNDDILTNISKGSLQIALDSNAPDTEKMVVLLRQELSDLNVELKEEKWYTAQLKTELEKVSLERDKLEEQKSDMEKEYMSQLRSAEEGYFEVAEENRKLKEDLIYSDYSATKERHDKLKQEAAESLEKVAEEQALRKSIEENIKVLNEEILLYKNEKDEDLLRLDGLQTGIDMLKKELATEHDISKENRMQRELVERENYSMKEEIEEKKAELRNVKSSFENELEKIKQSDKDYNLLQKSFEKEKEMVRTLEKEHMEQLKKMDRGDQGDVIQELTLEKGKLLETIASLECSIAERIKEHSGEIVNIRQEKMDVMVELKECQLEKGKTCDELERLQEKNKDLNKHIEKTAIEKNKTEEEIIKINSELGQYKTDVMTLREQLDESNDEKEIIMNELRKSQEDCKRTQAFLNENEKDNVQLNETLSNYEISNNNLNELVVQKDSIVEAMKQQHESEIVQLKSIIEDTQSKYNQEITALREKEIIAISELNQCREDLISAQSEVADFILKIGVLEDNVASLENRLETKEEHLLGVQSKLEAAEIELQKVCESCKNYEIQLCRLQEETRDSQGQISLLQKEIDQLQVNSAMATTELTNSIQEMKAENVKLETVANENALKVFELDSVIDNLKSEREQFITSSLQAEEKIIQFEDENVRIKEEVSNLKVELLSEGVAKDEMCTKFKQEETKLIDERNDLLQHSEDLKKSIEKISGEFLIEEKKWVEEKIHLAELLKKEQEQHQNSKDNHDSVESSLRIEISTLQRDVEEIKMKYEETVKSKEEVLNEIESSRSKILDGKQQISDLHSKLKLLHNEKNDLEGDVNILNVQLQSCNEEKSVLLERVLSAEEEHKKTKQKLVESNRKLDQSLSALQELGQENQNIQVQHMQKSNRQWTKDSECDSCKKCDKYFSFTVRKHHCRQCGLIYCSDCSCFSAVLAGHKKPVRVCEACSLELGSLRGSNVRRLSNASIESSVSTR